MSINEKNELENNMLLLTSMHIDLSILLINLSWHFILHTSYDSGKWLKQVREFVKKKVYTISRA